MLGRLYTRCRICRTRPGWRRNNIVIIEETDRRRLFVLCRGRGVSRNRCSLGGRALKLGLFLDDGKWLTSQSLVHCRKIREMCPPTTSSSPDSRVDGSGMPPSITQRLESYLVRIKFSILLSHSTRQHGVQVPSSPQASLTLLRERDRAQVSPPNICRQPISTIILTSIFKQQVDQLVGSRIAPFHHALELFIGPRIEIHGLHSADMCTHTPMDSGATNANEDSQIPRRPSWIYKRKEASVSYSKNM